VIPDRRPSAKGEESLTKATMTVSLAAIQDNYRAIAKKTAPAQTAAVVKANAYGLGASSVAQSLWDAGAREFFVAWAEEGIAIRQILSEAKIYVLNGVFDRDACVTYNLIPTLNDTSALSLWKKTNHPVAVQVDTGLNRLGFNAGDFAAADFSDLNVQLLFSHLACADTINHPMNAQQRERFLEAKKKLPKVRASLAASDGIFCGADFHFDLVRPGAALYGINPTPGAKNPMKNVVTLSAPILQLRNVEADGTVGYVATQNVKKSQRLATVGLGYADGVLRSLSNAGHLYYGDKALPILGRVSMDVVIVDAGDLALQAGDSLDILSEHQTADDLAKSAGTNGYEIMTALGNSPRIAKLYK
jgi:alanine racemase